MLVVTRVASATDTMGKRIMASVVGDTPERKVVPWNHFYNMDENHREAAASLAFDLGFSGLLAVVQVASKNGNRYFYIHN